LDDSISQICSPAAVRDRSSFIIKQKGKTKPVRPVSHMTLSLLTQPEETTKAGSNVEAYQALVNYSRLNAEER
jgi:hypothetical protein